MKITGATPSLIGNEVLEREEAPERVPERAWVLGRGRARAERRPTSFTILTISTRWPSYELIKHIGIITNII